MDIAMRSPRFEIRQDLRAKMRDGGFLIGLRRDATDADGPVAPDGDLDIAVSRYNRPNMLLNNDGRGVFTDVAADAGVVDMAAGTGGNVEGSVADEEVVVTISHSGYAKRIPLDTYKQQGRGGKGITIKQESELSGRLPKNTKMNYWDKSDICFFRFTAIPFDSNFCITDFRSKSNPHIDFVGSQKIITVD